jgi:hypothetical protein
MNKYIVLLRVCFSSASTFAQASIGHFKQKFIDGDFGGGAKCKTDGSSVRSTPDSVDIIFWSGRTACAFTAYLFLSGTMTLRHACMGITEIRIIKVLPLDFTRTKYGMALEVVIDTATYLLILEGGLHRVKLIPV